ncbi:methyltransferase [Streptomyces sp. TRM64462]|uniref:methyltransferase n=1 Tax=Streptomyces sp. TRM64462 TaxID=2741726 RepID=UPI001586CF62|nr:methyltransferase [Streptomyces sp. TRM64462]
MADDDAFVRLLRLKDTMTPWALRAAVTLGVPDLVADGEKDVSELAERSGTVPGALGRVLRLLARRGVFTEPAPGVFGPTGLSRLLQGDHPRSMRPWLDLEGPVARGDRTCVHILEALRTGGPVHERAYGRPVWDDLAARPELGAAFDAAMAQRASWIAGDVAAGFDWSAVRHVMDVGGGTGVVLAEVLRARPGLKGTLFDRAPTVAAGHGAWGASDAGQRCTFSSGSFFDTLPSGADACLLVNVLHDWADEHALTVLRRCAEAVGPQGRVLIAEHLVEEGAGGPGAAGLAELDLVMMLVYGGRERRLDELAELAGRAGLRVGEVSVTPRGLSLVVCEAEASAASG